MKETIEEREERLGICRQEMWIDFLRLCEKHKENIEVWEFIYNMIRFITQLSLETAPNKETALATIAASIQAEVEDHENI